MKQALRQLAEDFLSAILFFAIYELTGSLYLGIGLAIGVGLTQLVRRRSQGKPIPPMQWTSVALVVVFGSASLLFHTPRFMMVKPSIIHLSIAAFMLRRGWMTPYMPPIVQRYVGQSVIDGAGYAWAALMAALAFMNLIVALEGSLATWGWFITFGALGAKAAALGIQYGVFRVIVTRRIAAERRSAIAAGNFAYRPMIAE